MKKLVLCLTVLSVSVFVYGYEIERVDLGGGNYLNYVFSTDYSELENFAAREFGVRINIGQTNSWDDNSQNDKLAPQIRNLLRQYTQQGKYNVFAMAVYLNDYGDVEQILVNWCYRDKNTSVYKYMTTYWLF